jgi:periplasmic divalent cation tolerance protein
MIVLTTAPKHAAEEIASCLVDERLAACVNVQAPMTSTYWWRGKIEREEECQLVIKTSGRRLVELERRLHELHPYELPEFILIQAAGSGAEYAAWVDTETRDAKKSQL